MSIEKESEFSRKLIKGKIAEVIFEQMIRGEKRYTVIPFGYEHTVPMLAQYQDLIEVKHVIKNISDAPDFLLISENKKELYLVEVKYRKHLDILEAQLCAEKILKRWDSAWLFIATSDGFYCAPCFAITNNSNISDLSEKWVTTERQIKYLKLLNEFEK